MSLVVLRSVEEVRAWRASAPSPIGFVPTMGALHAGHAALIARAAADGGRVLVSIFVNPTQFDDPADLLKYPRTWDADLALAEAQGATAIWSPSPEAFYADEYRYRVTEVQISRQFCGAHRPGHFDGVLTVVLKLLLGCQADRAYFGEKDWQQLQLVRGMVQTFFVPTTIIPVPTVREPDGLALSSRNTRLTPAQRAQAPELFAALRLTATTEAIAARLTATGWIVDYVSEWDGRRLAAAHLGDVRLIDNVPLPEGPREKE